MSGDGLFSALGWIITGGIAGFIASVLLKAQRMGCLMNVGVGIAGAFVGGFIMDFLVPGGLVPSIGFLNVIINATLGAVILLIVLELILPGRQLGGK